MFNFASKVFNTLGDLINVEEPPKPATNQQSQPQRRTSGDSHFFQQPKARFHGPTSLSDHNAFREQASSSLRDPPQSSAPVYPYPSPSADVNHQQSSSASPNYPSSNYSFSGPSARSYGQPSELNYSTTGGNQYRSSRYEDKCNPSDADYNKDSFNINSNYNSSDRSSLTSDGQKEYGSFEERRTDDRDMNQKEEDRYLSSYDGNTEIKLKNRKPSHRESPQMNETNSLMYSNFSNLNYQLADSWSNDQNSESTSYDNAVQYNSPRSMVSNPVVDDSQFTDPIDLNLWREDYAQAWKIEENNVFEIKDDKISPSPPSQDEDAKNSSRSESESSDEISFGEALATGLIPPHITPEIAARMNIELINHPKAVIESIYGHSPGEVYTIPEEEDEIYSPTGADGVTSLRKQRMASGLIPARMETSNVLKELQNQQRRIAQNHQYDNSGKSKHKYESIGMDSKGEQNQQYSIHDAKLPKQVPIQTRYQNVKFSPDQVVGQPQPFQHQLPHIKYESNMPYQQHRSPENKIQQDRQQIQKVSRQENRQTNHQVDPRFPNQMGQQFYNDQRTFQNQPSDGRPPQHQHGQINNVDVHQKQQMLSQPESQLSSHDQTNRNHSYQTGFLPNTPLSVTVQGYDDNRLPQSASYCDNRLAQPPQFSDNRQSILNDGRPIQTQQPQPQQPYHNTFPQQQQYQEQYQQQQESSQQVQQQYQSLSFSQDQMIDNRQNQFMYPSNTRPGTEFQSHPPQNFLSQQQSSDNRDRPQHSGFQQQQLQYSQSNETWSNQPCTNYSHPPKYPSNSFPQQNEPAQGSSYPDSRSPHYYDNRQGYPLQDPRKTLPQHFQEVTPQLLSNQGSYQQQQNYSHPSRISYEFSQQDARVSQFPRRSLPLNPEILERRKRLPLRRYYSEERDGNIQEEFDRPSRRNSQAYENVCADKKESPIHHCDQRARYEKSHQRSSSLDSHHERVEQYAKSRSCSLERNRDLAIEEYEKENRRKMLSRTQSQGDEYVHEERRKHMQKTTSVGHASLSGRSKTESVEKARKSDIVQDKVHRVSSKETKNTIDSRQQKQMQRFQPSLSQNYNSRRATGNYCPQHKKFTSAVGSATKSSRRQLPKEPERRKLEKSFSTEKNSSKGDDNAQQRAGILSTGARKIERSGNLKISFSDPISNLLDPKNKVLSTTLNNTPESHSSKSVKNIATSNTNIVTTHHVCPFTRESTNVILNQVPSLHRNQSLDSQFRDSHLSVSQNACSHPIPIVTRTRSLDRYSSSDTNLNVSPYYHDHFSRPGSAPGLMYEPVHQQNNNSAALQLSLYEMHALKKEEKFWSDIYSALPADMKHLIANRGSVRNKFPMTTTGHQSVERPASSTSLEHRPMQRGMVVKGNGKCLRDATNSSLGERIGNRLRMLHEMKEQSKVIFNRRKPIEVLARRSASDGEYSFSSTTNFPLYWNLQRRPHSDSAIDLLERLEVPNPRPRISGSAYNSSEYLTTNPSLRVIDKSQSYLTSPSTNVPPSPAPTQPIKLRDTALRGDRVESVSHPTPDNRAGFFSCLQNIESLTRQYQEDFIQDEDEIYSDSGIPDSEYVLYDIHSGNRRKSYGSSIRRRNDHFDNV